MKDPRNAHCTRRLWLIALVVALGLATVALADHTPDPDAVTVAGSLQSELGCPGDWQPDCAATHLAFDDFPMFVKINYIFCVFRYSSHF